MLLDLPSLFKQHNLSPTGVVQVGVNEAQEHETFLRMGISKFVYVEPCQKAWDSLVERFGEDESVTLFQFAAGTHYYEADMFTETVNGGQSNSLLRPKEHLRQHPTITFDGKERVRVMPLDAISGVCGGCNFLSLDCQGAELDVLVGAMEILQDIDYVYSEVNCGETYEGCARVEQIDLFLYELGFHAVADYWVPNTTWGDKLFLRERK